MENPLWKKLIAEFVGTFALIFIGVASIAAASFAGIEGGAGLATIAIAHGFAIATMVAAVAHISGGHFNPAVTFGALIAKAISLGDAVAYAVTQLIGAAAAALVIRASLPTELWQKVKLGTPMLTKEGTVISFGQGVLIEAVLTFFLVWVVMGLAVDRRASIGRIAGLPIGFVIAMDIMAGGPFTGAAMNPARTFGPALVGGFWDDHLVYWIGPLVGAGVAAALFRYGILKAGPEEPERAAEARARTSRAAGRGRRR